MINIIYILILLTIIIFIGIIYYCFKCTSKKLVHIKDKITNIYIADDIIDIKKLDNNKFPDIKHKSKYKDSFVPFGEGPAKIWNVDANDSYHKQGVIVNIIKDLKSSSYLFSDEFKKKISKILKINYKKLSPIDCRYKVHLNESNGLWLHTDYRSGVKRKFLVLIYASNDEWKPKYGGELLIFTKNNNLPKKYDSKEIINGYQSSKRPLLELNKLKEGDNLILKNGIGGEWERNKIESFKCLKKVKPKSGRVVIMDYRNHYNIHAVSSKKKYDRKLIELWFSYDN